MQLQQKLLQFMQVNGLSQKTVAKAIGENQGALNQWLQGKYKGTSEKFDLAVQAYLEREMGKQAIKQLEQVLANTETTKRILFHAQAVHQSCDNGLLYGNAGMGKTTALRHYAKQNPDVILLEVTMTYSPSVVLKTIAKKVGVPVSGSLNDINEAILAKLSGSGRMIIVDEAENLSTRALEILRRLHDIAGVGLLLAGTKRLLVNLVGRHGELAQLHSRVGKTLALPEVVADDELTQIARLTLPSVSDTLLKEIVKHAQGSPRRLWKMMDNCDRYSKSHQEPINAEMVQVAKQSLLGG